jgi:hypothetical protein
MTFVAELARRILGGAAPAVVGLDPRLDALPKGLLPNADAPRRIAAFYEQVLPALARHVPVVKPNIAFFECYGSAGFAAYESTCAAARAAGILVLGYIKRGDIGSTAEAYAEGHAKWADAVTLQVEQFASGRIVHQHNPVAIDKQNTDVNHRYNDFGRGIGALYHHWWWRCLWFRGTILPHNYQPCNGGSGNHPRDEQIKQHSCSPVFIL